MKGLEESGHNKLNISSFEPAMHVSLNQMIMEYTPLTGSGSTSYTYRLKIGRTMHADECDMMEDVI